MKVNFKNPMFSLCIVTLIIIDYARKLQFKIHYKDFNTNDVWIRNVVFPNQKTLYEAAKYIVRISRPSNNGEYETLDTDEFKSMMKGCC